MRRACVFSGSSSGSAPEYEASAVQLGRELLDRGIGLVYGGASIGLMGTVADTVLAGGGEVTGVIPRQLFDKEIAHQGLSDLRVVESMHERKALMADLSDGVVALPGGYGTLEELTEAITWTQLGLQAKPCALLNVSGFYESLLEFVDHAVGEGFIREEHRELILINDSPAELLDAMVKWSSPEVAKWADNQDMPGR